MKDTAPIGLGIVTVAALFGLIGTGVAYVVWDMGAMGSLFVGAIIAVIVVLWLMFGWREPAPKMTSAASPNADPAPTVPASSTADAAPAAAPVTQASTPAPAAVAPEPAPAAAAPATPDPKPVAADGKPEFMTAARDGGPDDLKQIKGVGPKLEGVLHKMGVFHFDQVAGWRAAEIAWVDENLEGFKGRVSRDEWVKQAKVLAEGGTTEFSKKVKKGGVY